MEIVKPAVEATLPVHEETFVEVTLVTKVVVPITIVTKAKAASQVLVNQVLVKLTTIVNKAKSAA